MQYVEIEPTEAQTKESCDFFLGKNIGLTISLLEGTKISIQKNYHFIETVLDDA